MMTRKPLALLLSASFLLVLSACNSEQNTKSAAKSPTEATVNGVAISKNRIDVIAKQGGGPAGADSPEARKNIIDQLAMQMVVAEEAVKKGLDKSPEVMEQIEVIRQSILANAYVQDFIKTNTVSDEMLKAEYERIKATITGSEYKARHILVATEAEANEIIAKLKSDPGAFAKLAKEKSKDTGSGKSGGELGWFNISLMVPEFGEAVSKLEKGKITQTPVKTQFGYHVIQLEDSKPIEAPPFEEVKPELAQQLQQQNLKKQIDEMKAKAKIEIVTAPAPEKPADKPAAK